MGWGWMCPSIFSLHLLSSPEQHQQLGKGLLQRHTCLPGDTSLKGSCRGINPGHFPPGSSGPSHQKVPAPSFVWQMQCGSAMPQFAHETQSRAHLLVPLQSHPVIMTFSQWRSLEQMPGGEKICIPLLAPSTSQGPPG